VILWGRGMKLEPIIELPNMMTGMWRRLGVHAFQGKVTLDDMTRVEVAGSGWHRKNPGKVVEIVIIFPSEARMDTSERERMASIVKRWESVRTASATVILASGLVGSFQRSILTGLQMLAPPPHPTRVFGALPETATWILPYVRDLCGADVGGEALLEALVEFCATFQTTRRGEA
jgi:hypothetical protein